MESFHATTILSVRRDGKVVMGVYGQVPLGNTVVKANARKIRRLGKDSNVLAGFAGATADAFTLFELFEDKLSRHSGQLTRAAHRIVVQAPPFMHDQHTGPFAPIGLGIVLDEHAFEFYSPLLIRHPPCDDFFGQRRRQHQTQNQREDSFHVAMEPIVKNVRASSNLSAGQAGKPPLI